MMNNGESGAARWLVVVLIGALILVSIYAVGLRRQLNQANAELAASSNNQPVAEFATLFINTVLQADSEIDFETRLKLENSVRALNNVEILTGWQRFTGSQTEEEAQREVKNFLALLVSNIVE